MVPFPVHNAGAIVQAEFLQDRLGFPRQLLMFFVRILRPGKFTSSPSETDVSYDAGTSYQ